MLEPFVMGAGDPYFVMYVKVTGVLEFNRFRSDCKGWTTVASVASQSGAALVIAIATLDTKTFLLLM